MLIRRSGDPSVGDGAVVKFGLKCTCAGEAGGAGMCVCVCVCGCCGACLFPVETQETLALSPARC